MLCVYCTVVCVSIARAFRTWQRKYSIGINVGTHFEGNIPHFHLSSLTCFSFCNQLNWLLCRTDDSNFPEVCQALHVLRKRCATGLVPENSPVKAAIEACAILRSCSLFGACMLDYNTLLGWRAHVTTIFAASRYLPDPQGLTPENSEQHVSGKSFSINESFLKTPSPPPVSMKIVCGIIQEDVYYASCTAIVVAVVVALCAFTWPGLRPRTAQDLPLAYWRISIERGPRILCTHE